MKKTSGLLLAIFLALLAVGCAEKKNTLPAGEEILEHVSPYLEDTVFMDPATYSSLNDFLNAYLGLSEKEVSEAVLYMGAPHQNTTFFLMLTKAADADSGLILEKLESIMQDQVHTAEMGYMSGYTKYAIIEKGDKVFAIMHEDPEIFSELQSYLNSL